MTTEPKPLQGIKVVELSQNAAIPHCGRLLAGMGADVVKVEPPDGDAMRGLAQLAPNESKAYALINPGKRSTTTGMPIRFSATPAGVDRPSPGLGEHTSAVLAEIGFTNEQIHAFGEQGAAGVT